MSQYSKNSTPPKKEQTLKIRINSSGNRCGHDRQNPRLKLPDSDIEDRIPLVLRLVIQRLRDYFNFPGLLPALNFANGSTSQQRSERRESCILILSAMLTRMDLTSLRVGYPNPEGFSNFTSEYLAKQAGLTNSQTKGALRDLKTAGILTITRRSEKQEDGSYKGLAAVKCISKHFFTALGFVTMLEKERLKASRRLKTKMTEWAKNIVTQVQQGKNQLSIAALNFKVRNMKRKKPKVPITSPPV